MVRPAGRVFLFYWRSGMAAMLRLHPKLIFLIGLLLALAAPTMAGTRLEPLISELSKEFTPLKGYIIMPVNDGYLVDLGAGSGVRVGDLLTVLQSGAKVIHPITGEDLGTLDKRRAVLKVTQVESKFSHARQISGEQNLATGAPLKRFAALNAEFVAAGEGASELFERLRNAVPALFWQQSKMSSTENSSDPSPDIRFFFDGQRIKVTGPDELVLRSYSLPPQDKHLNARGKIDYPVELVDGSIRYTPNRPRVKIVGDMHGAILMADFAQVDGSLLLAATDGLNLWVYRVGQTLELLDETRFHDRKIHALSWWQPEPGKLFLALSGTIEGFPNQGTSVKTTPLGRLLRFKDDRLAPGGYADPLFFLGSFDRDGDAKKELLLGQELDLDNFYGRVLELRPTGTKLKAVAPNVDLPYPFAVQGSIFAHLNDSAPSQTININTGALTIYHGAKIFYQARKSFGGSLSQLSYDRNPESKETLFGQVHFEVNPVVADVDGDGHKEIVAVSSYRPQFSINFGSKPTIEAAGLAVLKYQEGGTYRNSLWLESEFPIQGLYADDERILFISSDLQDPAGTDQLSRLMMLPLFVK